MRLRRGPGPVLSSLRFQPEAALTAQIPVSENRCPGRSGGAGRERNVRKERDYRGAEVLADIRSVPDTPWFLVAKVDTGRDPRRSPLSRPGYPAFRRPLL